MLIPYLVIELGQNPRLKAKKVGFETLEGQLYFASSELKIETSTKLKLEADEQAWQLACEKNTIDAYEVYLNDNKRHSNEAKSKINHISFVNMIVTIIISLGIPLLLVLTGLLSNS
ncbi:hypothetical protein QUF50_04580 [Thiotrichales bacterium HSG1]|nr:hypothetical protein [Thiotrichales bacterium HSG1]